MIEAKFLGIPWWAFVGVIVVYILCEAYALFKAEEVGCRTWKLPSILHIIGLIVFYGAIGCLIMIVIRGCRMF